MQPIKKYTGVITSVIDLSPTAREIAITLPEPITFYAGSFVNVFIEDNGVKLRRAFSISSSDGKTRNIALSVRLYPKGAVTPLFWKKDIIGTTVDIMGPLGLNTTDKMQAKKVFLFGFGIGVGVIKSIAEYCAQNEDVDALTIFTGNRSEDEILYKDFFDTLAKNNLKVAIQYVVSAPKPDSPYLTGYVQEHIADLDFNNSDVYVCGQDIASESVIKVIDALNPEHCTFFIESFH